MGRNCRFLQGPATNPEHVQQLRTALTADPPQAVTVTLLNYSKSGRPFWNALHVAPMRDAEGKLEYFIGIQLDVSEAALQEENGPAAADGVPTGAWRGYLCRVFASALVVCLSLCLFTSSASPGG